MWFVRFSYYKTANRIAPCGVVRCGALLLTVRCGYAILQAVFAVYTVWWTPLLMDKQPVYQDIYVEFSSTGWRSFLIRQQKLVWKFAKLAITYHQILAGFSVIIHPMHLWILYRSSHRLLLANLWLWLSFYVVDKDWGRNSVWKMHHKWEHIICYL